MKHPVENNVWGEQKYARMLQEHDKLQKAIQKSRKTPYKQIATIFGLLQLLYLAILAIILKTFRIVTPSSIDKKLADEYFYVPEMALHKKIELMAFINEYR